MGNVFFDTDVNKTVDIIKTVDLTVNKDVFSFVDLTGNLATAEASADAVGGAGGSSTDDFFFVIDDFTDTQFVQVFGNGADGTFDTGNPRVGVAPSPPGGPGGSSPPSQELAIPPDGLTFEETSIPGGMFQVFPGPGEPLRTIDVENFALPAGGFSQSFSTTSINASDNGLAQFSSDDNTNGNSRVTWEADIDGDGIYGEPEDAFAVIPQGASLADCLLVVSQTSIDPGPEVMGEDYTLRVEFEFEDADGDVATGAVAMGDLQDQDLAFSLAEFVVPGLAPPPGTDLLPGPGEVYEVDHITADIDFQNIVRMQLSVLGEVNAATSDIPLNLAFENPANEAYDGAVDDIYIFCPGQREGGNLAETDTFAQVTEDGAFSFSESLAAFDPAEADMIIT